jgi:hypothetical protein
MARRALTPVAVIAVAAASAALVTGCGSKHSDPNIAWAGSVCKAISSGGSQITMPTLLAKQPKDTKNNITAFLGNVTSQLSAIDSALKSAGPPPSGDGTAEYQKTQQTLTGIENRLSATRAKLARTPVTTAASLTAALKGFSDDLAAYGQYQGPVADMRADPRLQTAFDKAPECASLNPHPSSSASASSPAGG